MTLVEGIARQFSSKDLLNTTQLLRETNSTKGKTRSFNLAPVSSNQKMSAFTVASLIGASRNEFEESDQTIQTQDLNTPDDDLSLEVSDDVNVEEEDDEDDEDDVDSSGRVLNYSLENKESPEKSPGRENWNKDLASDEDHDLSSGKIDADGDDLSNSAGYAGQYRPTEDASSPYGCLYCDKMFSRLSYLKRHEQVHSDAMPYQCDYCQRYFKHKRSRDRHVRLHTGDKRYACTVCTACFSRSDHLKIHLKTHNSTKPFQCLICSRGYTTMAALTAHTQSHHRGSAWQHGDLLRCLRCTAVFASTGDLHKHSFLAHGALPHNINQNLSSLHSSSHNFTYNSSPANPSNNPITSLQSSQNPSSSAASSALGLNPVSTPQKIQLPPLLSQFQPQKPGSSPSAGQPPSRPLNPGNPLFSPTSPGRHQGFINQSPFSISHPAHQNALSAAAICAQNYLLFPRLSAPGPLIRPNTSFFTRFPGHLSSHFLPPGFPGVSALQASRLSVSSANPLAVNGQNRLNSASAFQNPASNCLKSPVSNPNPAEHGLSDFISPTRGSKGFSSQPGSREFSNPFLPPTLILGAGQVSPGAEFPYQAHSSRLPNVLRCPVCPNTQFQRLQDIHQHFISVHQNNNNALEIQEAAKKLAEFSQSNLSKESLVTKSQSEKQNGPNSSLALSLQLPAQSRTSEGNSTQTLLAPVKESDSSASSKSDQEVRKNQENASNGVKAEMGEVSEDIACALCAQIFCSEAEIKRHVENDHLEFGISKVCKVETNDDELVGEKAILKPEESRKRLLQAGSSNGSLLFAVDNLIQKDSKRKKRDNENERHHSHSDLAQNETKLSEASTNQAKAISDTTCKPSPPSTNNNELLCSHCGRSFQSADEFQVHLNSHLEMFLKQSASNGLINSTSVFCPECGIRLPFNETARQIHLFSHFSEIQPQEFACFHCKDVKFSSTEKLHQHLMEFHSKCLFRCSLCDETFDSRISLQVHFAAQHSNKKSCYRCKRCNACFYNDIDFEKHIFTEHLQLIKQSSPNSLTSPPFHAFAMPKMTSPSSISPSELKTQQGKHQCMFCGKECSSEEQLTSHVYTHMKQFNCLYCEKVFHLSSLLEQHIKAFHMKELLTPCSENSSKQVQNLTMTPRSSADVFSPSSLEVSIASSNNGEVLQFRKSSSASVACGACSVSFSNELEMLKHKSTHLLTLSTPRCTLCNAVFGSPSNLAAHMFEHKGINVGNLCLHCSFPLTSEEHFYKHFDQHIMDSLVSPASLRSPESSMAGEKKHVECIVCKQPLTSAAELQTHAKFHSHIDVTARGYRCSVCYQTFQTKTNLHCKVDGNGCPFYICGECKKNLQTSYPLDSGSSHNFLLSRASFAPPVDNFTRGLSAQRPENFKLSAFLEGYNKSPNQLQSTQDYKQRVPGGSSPACNSADSMTGLAGPQTTKTTPSFCSQCPAVFTSIEDQVTHMASHLAATKAPINKTYQCIKCQKVFATEQAIHNHIAQHLAEEGNIHDCKLCAQVFDTPGKLQCHLIEHSFHKMDGFICPICHVVNKSSKDLQLHVVSHRDLQKPHACSNCAQSFFFGAELEHHRIQFHSEILATPVSEKVEEKIVLKPRPSSTDDSLMTRSRSTNFSPVTLNRVMSPPSSFTPINSRCHRCPFCMQNFISESHLRSHVRIHFSEDRNLKCSFCVDEFSSIPELQQHCYRSHRDCLFGEAKSSLKCDQCDAIFPSLSNLQNHMGIHSVSRLYPCNECDRVFSLARNLSTHMRSHGSEKPYSCPICRKQFTRKENRKIHMKSHSGTKPYLCPHCGKMFSRKSHVRDHLRSHDEVSQSELSISKTGQSELRSDIMQCELCSHESDSLASLKTHLEIEHSEDVSFVTELNEIVESSMDYSESEDTHTEDESTDSKLENQGENASSNDRTLDV